MKRFKGVRKLLCFASLSIMLFGLLGAQIALAAEEDTDVEEPVVEKIELSSRFPVKQGESGSTFEFEVSLDYAGNEPRVFYFDTDLPEGWDASIMRQYSEDGGAILAQTLEPNQTYAPSITINMSPGSGIVPEPGEYLMTLTANSGDMSDSIQLKAIVTNIPETYDVKFTTVTGRLDFPVEPGEDNPIHVIVTNTGSGTLTNISFTSVKSEGWGTIFSPAITESLAPGESMEAQIMMTPPRKTIAGDYRILIRVGADSPTMRLQEQVDLRIRVQASTMWGGVGIAIVAGVIVALAFMFRNLGRR